MTPTIKAPLHQACMKSQVISQIVNFPKYKVIEMLLSKQRMKRKSNLMMKLDNPNKIFKH